MLSVQQLLTRFDPTTGEISGVPVVQRHLRDLPGCFVDARAFDEASALGNPLVYSVASVEPASGEGDLHYGLARLMPGRIGREYFMTKGHLHAWRLAAEVYLGLAGEGVMLLEDEASGESRMVDLRPNGIVYVPAHTAHRTVNVGSTPCIYLGVYPARAGHDYQAIARKNFRCVVIEQHGVPTLVERNELVT